MKPVYERFIENPDFTKPDFVELIKCAEDPEAVRRLKEEAVRIREIYYGKKVFTRGLIEYTNYCKNDCYYCGIRKSNTNAKRYRLTEDEIMACCEMGMSLDSGHLCYRAEKMLIIRMTGWWRLLKKSRRHIRNVH